MTVPSADGLDVLITAAGFILLLAACLYISWRREDQERREQRAWQRDMR